MSLPNSPAPIDPPKAEWHKSFASEAPDPRRHHVGTLGDIISECPGDFIGMSSEVAVSGDRLRNAANGLRPRIGVSVWAADASRTAMRGRRQISPREAARMRPGQAAPYVSSTKHQPIIRVSFTDRRHRTPRRAPGALQRDGRQRSWRIPRLVGIGITGDKEPAQYRRERLPKPISAISQTVSGCQKRKLEKFDRRLSA
jgi:hypothetical protein